MNRFAYTIINILAACLITLIAYTIHPYAGIAAAVVCAILIFWYILPLSAGLSLHQQRKQTKYRKTTTREDRHTVSVDRSTGMTISHDGDTASMFIELTPSPLETIAYTDDGTGIPSIPLPVIISELHQYDIDVDNINVISFGYRTADNAPYSRAYNKVLHGHMGRLRTIIEVTIRLSASLPAVNTRRREDDGPEVGLTRVTEVAAKRLRNKLTDNGWRARIMSKSELQAFDNEVSPWVGNAFDHEHRTDMGEGNHWVAMYSSPGLVFNPSKLQTNAKAFGVVRHIRPQAKNQGASIKTYVALMGEDKTETVAHKSKLKKMPGVQGDLVSYLLPLAPNPPINTSSPTVTKQHPNDFDVETGPAWGVGALIGETKEGDRRRVSLTTVSAKGEVLYTAANPKAVRNILARLAASGEHIIVESPSEQWKEWVRFMESPRITTKRGQADIVVTEKEGEIPSRAGILTIRVGSDIPRSAKYSLQQLPDGSLRSIARNTYRDITWTAGKEEQYWLI